MSLAIETLDQLDGGPMPLTVLRTIFSSESDCSRTVLGLLNAGDIALHDAANVSVPKWRWRELFADGGGTAWDGLVASLTPQGMTKIG